MPSRSRLRNCWINIFGIGEDGAIYHKGWDGSSWGPSDIAWESLGGTVASRLIAVSWGAHRLDVFALETASDVHHKLWGGSARHATFSGAWENLEGNIFHGAPAAAACAANLVDVFSVIGIKEVYQKY